MLLNFVKKLSNKIISIIKKCIIKDFIDLNYIFQLKIKFYKIYMKMIFYCKQFSLYFILALCIKLKISYFSF